MQVSSSLCKWVVIFPCFVYILGSIYIYQGSSLDEALEAEISFLSKIFLHFSVYEFLIWKKKSCFLPKIESGRIIKEQGKVLLRNLAIGNFSVVTRNSDLLEKFGIYEFTLVLNAFLGGNLYS